MFHAVEQSPRPSISGRSTHAAKSSSMPPRDFGLQVAEEAGAVQCVAHGCGQMAPGFGFGGVLAQQGG